MSRVDLSGPLILMFERAKLEYLKARRSGDLDLARKKALECAKILRLLAENSPGLRDLYLEKASKWIKVARSIKGDELAKPEIVTTRKEDELKASLKDLIVKTNVKWSDIGGLWEAKRVIMETVVIAGLKRPESVKPWKGILLFGPPGTGKTLLASAAAGSLNATFFNVSIDRVLSKYFGESSKLISALYSLAREKAPSIVFLDEIDALSLSRRRETSDALRRTLSSLLVQLDGLKIGGDEPLVLTIAATNAPWDLDKAILSRFPQRIYVPLPDRRASKEIIRICTRGLDISRLDLEELASRCVENLYSGRDISNLCQQAIWNMIRDENRYLYKLAELPYDKLRSMRLRVRPLAMEDFYEAFKKIKSPLTRRDVEKYEKWNEAYGYG